MKTMIVALIVFVLAGGNAPTKAPEKKADPPLSLEQVHEIRQLREKLEPYLVSLRKAPVHTDDMQQRPIQNYIYNQLASLARRLAAFNQAEACEAELVKLRQLPRLFEPSLKLNAAGEAIPKKNTWYDALKKLSMDVTFLDCALTLANYGRHVSATRIADRCSPAGLGRIGRGGRFSPLLLLDLAGIYDRAWTETGWAPYQATALQLYQNVLKQRPNYFILAHRIAGGKWPVKAAEKKADPPLGPEEAREIRQFRQSLAPHFAGPGKRPEHGDRKRRYLAQTLISRQQGALARKLAQLNQAKACEAELVKLRQLPIVFGTGRALNTVGEPFTTEKLWYDMHRKSRMDLVFVDCALTFANHGRRDAAMRIADKCRDAWLPARYLLDFAGIYDRAWAETGHAPYRMRALLAYRVVLRERPSCFVVAHRIGELEAEISPFEED